jgi:uncharacterized membrane protein
VSAPAKNGRARVVAGAIAMLASAVWLGGLVVLGAVVAPTIFKNVPSPASADAMTLVFRRFDGVAMTCGAIVLVVEAWRAFARLEGPRTRVDMTRMVASAGADALAAFEGAVVSPKIAALHASGAIRGLGLAGEQLAAAHTLAENVAKAELALLVAAVLLNAAALARRA